MQVIIKITQNRVFFSFSKVLMKELLPNFKFLLSDHTLQNSDLQITKDMLIVYASSNKQSSKHFKFRA